MWSTVAKPLEALKISPPFDSLAASLFPQRIVIGWRSLPLITGIRTHMLAVPSAGFHSSI